ncbi:glycosyltransferase [Comamonas sp. JUb58]|uniref:glycosyltransferase n=1 Tax=Comamonas sp. JUb58 TaxID=2485114 RepID=UPI00105EEE68|nr:glycosyltransferase [Comamonas sp. JUb58]TDS82496.1 GT2 family glycosyltransferase [Comamonas sp. JUb58]
MPALKITTVVVSYNRQKLLEKCLLALTEQTCPINHVIVVDNFSTDGTLEWVRKWLPANLPNGELLALGENTGGAGGFAAGLKHAINNGSEWIWMMDDDAKPHPNALEELMCTVDNPHNIYGSLAVNSSDTSWLTDLLDPPLGQISRADEVPTYAKVRSLPFLGFLIHRDLVNRIGLPDAGFFIAADDVEYCIRAQNAGAAIFISGKSRIEHPKSYPTIFKILGHEIVFLSLPPWKRYYDTRNRLLIARTYYGMKLFTQTIPGSFIRLIAVLLKEPRKLAQVHAFIAGFIDGISGIKGKRHDFWRIR